MPGPVDDVLRDIDSLRTAPGISGRTRNEAASAIPQGDLARISPEAQRAQAARDTMMSTAEVARVPAAQGVVTNPQRASSVLSFLKGLVNSARSGTANYVRSTSPQDVLGAFNPVANWKSMLGIQESTGDVNKTKGRGKGKRRVTKKSKVRRKTKSGVKRSRNKSTNLER